MAKRKHQFMVGDEAIVTFWNSEKGCRDTVTATCERYDLASDAWYFKQPCPAVWAYPVDMKPVKKTKTPPTEEK